MATVLCMSGVSGKREKQFAGTAEVLIPRAVDRDASATGVVARLHFAAEASSVNKPGSRVGLLICARLPANSHVFQCWTQGRLRGTTVAQ